MADSEVRYTQSKVWVDSATELITKAQRQFETDPESYREFLKKVEREKPLAVPRVEIGQDQRTSVEASMEAIIDLDPRLRGLDMGRIRSTMDFTDKVKQRLESNPETYDQFLKAFNDEMLPAEGAWERIHDKMKIIFANDPDLLKDFESLAPMGSK